MIERKKRKETNKPCFNKKPSKKPAVRNYHGAKNRKEKNHVSTKKLQNPLLFIHHSVAALGFGDAAYHLRRRQS
jgi:hypothetical protein